MESQAAQYFCLCFSFQSLRITGFFSFICFIHILSFSYCNPFLCLLITFQGTKIWSSLFKHFGQSLNIIITATTNIIIIHHYQHITNTTTSTTTSTTTITTIIIVIGFSRKDFLCNPGYFGICRRDWPQSQRYIFLFLLKAEMKDICKTWLKLHWF